MQTTERPASCVPAEVLKNKTTKSYGNIRNNFHADPAVHYDPDFMAAVKEVSSLMCLLNSLRFQTRFDFGRGVNISGSR